MCFIILLWIVIPHPAEYQFHYLNLRLNIWEHRWQWITLKFKIQCNRIKGNEWHSIAHGWGRLQLWNHMERVHSSELRWFLICSSMAVCHCYLGYCWVCKNGWISIANSSHPYEQSYIWMPEVEVGLSQHRPGRSSDSWNTCARRINVFSWYSIVLECCSYVNH